MLPYLPIALALQAAYERNFETILPVVVQHVMQYIRDNFKARTEDGRGHYDPKEINEESLLAALKAVGIKSYLTNVSIKGGE